MVLPKPVVALKDHCSVVYNNTLYTFQPDAFQSLELRPGGKWSPLPMDVSTNGSVCVQGSPMGEDSLFIVGGTANSSAPHWYSGLQQYSFKDKKWKQLTPLDTSAKSRVGHSAAYLNKSSSILIFAGSQDNKFPTAQTFSMLTIPPYTVGAYNPGIPPIIPPLIQPLIIPLNASHAVLLGGDSHNKNLSTFSPDQGWQRFPATLKIDPKNSSDVQAVITDGSDGIQLLEFFDMSASPNEILTQSLRQDTENRKRQDRPAYDNTLASSTSRTGFSLAQDPAGLVVISGGAPNDSDYLCLFNQTGNQWIDAAQFFEAKPTSVVNPTTTTSSSIPTAPPSSTSAPTHESHSKSHPMTILGATLGAVFGLVALLLIILLLLRCIRRRQASNNGRDYEDKHGMDFADPGVDFMPEAGGSFTTNSNHKRTGSGQSSTSRAIMSGSPRAGSQQSKRGFFHKAGDSSGSAKSFFSRAKSPLAPSPPVISGPIQPVNPRDRNNQVTVSPEPKTEPRADVGWSRYFTNNSATNLAQSPPGNAHHESASRPTTYASNSQSDYESSRITSSNAHESAEVQPLSIRTNVAHPSNSRVVSPTSGLPLPGLALSSSGPGADPPSPSTLVSDIDEEEHRRDEDGRHASEGMASWTPVAASDRGSTWTDRPNSSIFAESSFPHPGERVRIPNFPRVPSTARNSTVYNSQAEPVTDSRGMRSVVSREFKTPHGDVHDRELPEIGSRRAAPSAYGPTSDGTMYPRRPEEMASRVRRGPEPEDMSWLNLGR
ncbi:hypothetical protein MMC29_001850 [Sticta canariensis]|nr:hypothetical protein [Sticta canariensis]